MILSANYAESALDDIKALFDGGTLTVYSVARPVDADHAVDRSGVLATFTFASPAFTSEGDDLLIPVFVENPVPASHVGTPGFARARKADGTTIADFSAGPGDREIKFAEVSCSGGAPVKITSFRILPESDWPERPDYFYAHPRPGYEMPKEL